MKANGLRIVYMGGKQAGCIGLLTLCGAQCEVLSVVAYDELVGRVAEGLEIPIAVSIHDESFRRCVGQSDLLVSVHGCEVVPSELLCLPRYGGINVHPCLYAYKGVHPVERLLRDGNPRASVGVHRMIDQVDGGEVLLEEFIDVAGKRSVEEVYNALYPLYATTLLKALSQLRRSHESALSR